MKPLPWERVPLTIEDGTHVLAVAPIIVSASRATDIPALFGPWFISQLDRGYTQWINPFNGKPQYVSFEKTRCIAFWSKNPAPMLRCLDNLDRKRIDYFFQFTLNDYEQESFEPGLPSLDQRIATLVELSNRIGRTRLLWRFDPLILTKEIGPSELLEKIDRVGTQIHPYISRLTVSLLSPYRTVLKRMTAHGIHPRGPSTEEVATIAHGLAGFAEKWGIEVVTCAEQFDLERFGVRTGSCIDPVYLTVTFPGCTDIQDYINRHTCADLFGNDPDILRKAIKDPGQRPLCGCMASKDIGRYGTCTHGCIYCYADKNAPV